MCYNWFDLSVLRYLEKKKKHVSNIRRNSIAVLLALLVHMKGLLLTRTEGDEVGKDSISQAQKLMWMERSE